MSHSVAQTIDAWVEANREALLQEFKEFLRIPSLTGYEGEAQKFMLAQYQKLGLAVDVFEPDLKELFERYPEIAQYPSSWEPELDLAIKTEDICTYEQWQTSGYADQLNYRNRPNVVGTLRGTGGGRSLILNGHVDTVTVGDPAAWQHPPFAAEQVEDRIYARGASDMKSGLLACVKAVEALAAAGIKLRGDVILQSVVNEEHAGNGTLACMARGYRADAAICADGTNTGYIKRESGGGVYWSVRVIGREVHTGGRWQGSTLYGVSAIEKMAPVIQALNEQERLANAEGVRLSLGMGTIKGGGYDTSTAAQCTLSGVAYFTAAMGTDVQGIQRVKQLLRKAVEQAAQGDEWLQEHKPQLFFTHYDDAYVCPEDAPIISVLQDAGEQVLGKKPHVGAVSACDLRHLGNRGDGMPAVAYGPYSFGAHAPNEFITEQEYLNYIKILALAVYQWCK